MVFFVVFWTGPIMAGVRFERLWPTFRQPFTVGECSAVTIGKDGCIYIVDKVYACVHKFTRDGSLITQWGTRGTGQGQFDDPYGIASDSSGNIYVADSGNARIQKFTSNGTFLMAWGGFGIEDGKFILPIGIEIDSKDHVYVTDDEKVMVQKFTSAGMFVLKWGGRGQAPGQFARTSGIAVDAADNVYIGDRENNTIQKFTSTGELITLWGQYGTGDGQFDFPYGIAVDAADNIYVSDRGNSRIQRFTSDGVYMDQWGDYGINTGEFYLPQDMAIDDKGIVYITEYVFPYLYRYSTNGQFISQWGTEGNRPGEFSSPQAVAVDSSGNIYITDTLNNRVQKFDSRGKFLLEWGSEGASDGRFKSPYAIAVDSNDHVHVTDVGNHRVQKFTADGAFITKWGGYGGENGQFYYPIGLAIDSQNNVFVADNGNYVVGLDKPRIQKFGSDGSFLLAWGSFGTGNGQFVWPEGLAVDAEDRIYVVDTGFNPYDDTYRYSSYPSIQKFSSQGTFLARFGSFGTGNGQFVAPKHIGLDAAGNMIIADSENHRIQKLSPSGAFLDQWGTHGTAPGQFHYPTGIAVGTDQRIHVVDTQNNRIQSFSPLGVSGNSKAVIIAGGGNYPSNTLWDATRMSANFAYRALLFQNYTKSTICYLSEDMQMDLDLNGLSDDVDGDCTAQRIEHAITVWAKDADDLVIYLVDHGGTGIFLMSGFNPLKSSDLAAWINTLQGSTDCRITVVYDACRSGSFIADLQHARSSERIVITSASGDESAYFMNQGAVSFSSYFWTHIFNGLSVKEAFDLSRSIMAGSGFQTPLMDDNGNGIGNDALDGSVAEKTFLGAGTPAAGDEPVIGTVSGNQVLTDSSVAVIRAENITAGSPIIRVWGIVHPPGAGWESSAAVQSLPEIELIPQTDSQGKRTGIFQAQYNGFDHTGTYRITIHARDAAGNLAVPRLTQVSVDRALKGRAILVMGSDLSDPLYPFFKPGMALAYRALKVQGFSDDDIYCMAPETWFDGVDASPSKSGIRHAVDAWAAQGTRDALFYFIGSGRETLLQVNGRETVSMSELRDWLTTLAGQIDGELTVILDACRSGSFITGADRPGVWIASCRDDQPAGFLGKGDISFSTYFWKQVLAGDNLMNAFISASQALSIFSDTQTPLLESNNNGTANEDEDYSIARNRVLGTGIILAESEIAVQHLSAPQILETRASATITVDQVISVNPVENVWAVIVPPGYSVRDPDSPVTDFHVLNLGLKSDGSYNGTYYLFDSPGVYTVSVYAVDRDGHISFPVKTTVTQTSQKCKTDVTGGMVFGNPVVGETLSFLVMAENDCEKEHYYRFSLHPDYGTDRYDGLGWTAMTDTEYVTVNMVQHRFDTAGKYIVVAWVVTDPENTWPAGVPIMGMSVDISENSVSVPCRTRVTGFTMSGETQTASSVSLSVLAENTCAHPLYYRFSMHPYYGTDGYDGRSWTGMTDTEWVGKENTDYRFTKAGRYVLVVWAVDEPGNLPSEGIPIIGWSVDID